jgi:hypothetical protein
MAPSPPAPAMLTQPRAALRVCSVVFKGAVFVCLPALGSLKAFQDMVSSPEYAVVEEHRFAGLAGQVNLQARSRL